MIYLDNAASTPILPEVMMHLTQILNIYGNPSSIHSEGKKAKQLIYDATDIIANSLNCNAEEIYFTTGATMSNNAILQGFNGKKYISSIEHEDIQILSNLYGYTNIIVDKNGFVDTDVLEYYASKSIYDNKLFSIQCANSEIGTIQNIKKISDIIHKYPNNYLHVDATQYIPYFKTDVQSFKIDALSMSGQKIGCIKGTGLLYINSHLLPLIHPLIYGKQGLFGGTENVFGISCLGVAFNNLNYKNENMIILRDYLIDGLDGLLIGDSCNRLPNNVCVMFDNVDAQTLVMLLSEYGICCSAGSACSSGDTEPSNTLLKIGLSEKQANSCVRFTLNKNTTFQDIKTTIKTVNNAVAFLRGL